MCGEVGRVVHSSLGFLLMTGGSSNILCEFALVMEVETVLEAMMAVMDVGVDKVMVETDCQQLIKMLQDKDTLDITLEGLIHDIRYLCSSFGLVEFTFGPLQCNDAAHLVASFVS